MIARTGGQRRQHPSASVREETPPARIAELRKAGVVFRNQIESGPGGQQIQIEDPDGNPIELFKPAE